MSTQTNALLEAFEALPEEDKRLFTVELLRRAVPYDAPGRVESDRWLQLHEEQFMGKWVALKDGALIAAGDNGKEVYDEDRAAGVDCPLLLHLTLECTLRAGYEVTRTAHIHAISSV